MILVTGATGTIGSQVVRQLAAIDAPHRAMSRNPSAGVRADFEDPSSLARAVEGVTSVFLVTAPESPTPRHDLALLTAAENEGVTKIVKLSAIGTGTRFGGQTVGAWHLAAENAVAASGMAWTILRPASFASNFLWYRSLISTGDPIPALAGAGRQGVVDPRDVAAVAVAALTTDEHEGRRYELTGPELLTFADQAAILAKVLDREVRTTDLTLEEARQQLSDTGMPPEAVTAMSAGLAWARADGAAYLTPAVPDILPRPATSFHQWATDHRAAFA